MLALVIVAVVISTFYILLWIGWERIPMDNVQNEHQGVTVLIPVRNESKNIRQLLEKLADQHFPKHLMEVIIIDDHSEDNTVEIVKSVAMHVPFPLKCIQLDKDQFGKKTAAMVGNEIAKFDIILCTDGDTSPGKNWIRYMTGPIAKRKKQMVSGPVKMIGDRRIERIQQLEFMGLIGMGAVSLFLNKPTMCNGANMAYRSSAFETVNGYLDNLHIPSGDDEFLMRKISSAFPGLVSFVKSPKALVCTPSKPTIYLLWAQRVRWISKWRFHKSILISLLSILGFIVFTIFSFFFLYLMLTSPLMSLISLLLVSIGVGFYLRWLSEFFDIKMNILDLILLVFIYPFYAVVLGIASIFGSYSWKGRSY